MKICDLNLHSLKVTDDDILQAMKQIPGYLDITPADFMEVYQVAYKHVLERLTSSIKAEHIMTREVVTVDEGATLLSVAQLMASHNISGLPVLNTEGKVSGIISEKDFITRMNASKLPSFMHVIMECLEVKGCVVQDLKQLSAKDIMSSPPISVALSVPVSEVANILEFHKVNRVPVLDEDSNLAGIIARSDLVQVICR